MMKFGLIGAGKIANAFSKAAKESGVILEAVASRNIDNAISFKNEYGYNKAYGSYEEILNDKEVEAIYLATPHGLHYEQMLMIIKHKKHILCEKAFTLSKLQAEHIFLEASKHGVYVMEAMWTRFLPIIKELKNELNSNYLGDIQKFEANFAFESIFDPNNRLYNKELGGGALLDIGIYPITFANIFLGVPRKISATAILSETLVDTEINIVYEYDNQIANLFSSILKDSKRDAVFHCQNGTIIVPRFWCAEEAFVYDLNNNLIKHIKTPHNVNGYEYEILEFIKAIETKNFTNDFMKTSDTLEILRQTDIIRSTIGVKYDNEDKLI